MNPALRVHDVSVSWGRLHAAGSDGMAIVCQIGFNGTGESCVGGEAPRALPDRTRERRLSRQTVNKPHTFDKRSKIVVVGIAEEPQAGRSL